VESLENTKQQADAGVKLFYKTIIKSVIWVTLALVITYFFPEATWIWYFVVAFIVIGLGTAVILKVASNKNPENAQSE
jgi:hypothetical protein